MNNRHYKTVYWTILAGIVLLGGILEVTEQFDGMLEGQTMLEFYCQYSMIIITLLTVYLALKLVNKNPVLRMAIIEGPLLFNIFFYHAFMKPSFIYLAIIGLLAYVFVYPSKTADNDIDNNVTEK